MTSPEQASDTQPHESSNDLSFHSAPEQETERGQTSPVIISGEEYARFLTYYKDIQRGGSDRETATPRRLPNNIPNFSGNSSDYLSWINSFTALILDEQHSAKQKMAALIASTKHITDLTHIGLYPCDETGLEEALKYLEGVYGNKMRIVDAAVANLERAKFVRGMDSEAITRLRAVFMAAVASAKLVGKATEYQERLKTAVMTKLPFRLQIEVKNKECSNTIQLDTIEAVLTEEMGRAQELEQYDSRPPRAPEGRKRFNTGDTSQVFRMQTREYICPFDGQKHRFRDCPLTVEEKLKTVYQQKRCINCLGAGHLGNECFSTKRCMKCGAKHHSYLCQVGDKVHSDVERDKPEGQTLPATQMKKLFTPMSYKTLMVRINQRPVRVLFDEGAGDNFITHSAAKRLKLEAKTGPTLNIFGFGSAVATQSSQYTTAIMEGNSNSRTVEATFCVVPSLGDGNYPMPAPTIISLMNTHKRKGYRDDSDYNVEIIIGIMDSQIWLSNTTRLVDDHRGRYSTQGGILGTVVYGGKGKETDSKIKMILTPEDVVQEVERSSKADKDDYVERYIKEKVRVVTGRIEVDIPLAKPFKLESNELKCYRRMMNSYDRWRKTETLAVLLETFNEWKANGIIEPVTGNSPKTHVLSYHIVTKLSSETTKHRIVFNGSLEDSSGNTLNDQLFKGHTTWNLIRSFVEFRSSRYPLVGDLRKAFLMVQVAETDRNLFQFFWPSLKDRILYRFARVPFGTSASPFLLYAAICKIIQTQSLIFPCLQQLINWFYVDDIICSFDTPEERLTVKEACDTGMNDYGFQIGWKGEKEETDCSLLGLSWHNVEDTLTIKIGTLETPRTVRQLASLIPSIFDPCGYVEPMTAALRRSFSDAWKRSPDWNSELMEDNIAHIDNVLRILRKQPFTVTRWLGTDRSQKLRIHLFTDANDRSIGTAVYAESQRDTQKLNLLLAKALLHARRTIAEAELDAIVMAIDVVDRKIGIYVESIHLWTDSLINYHRLCIKSVNQLKYQQARKVMTSWETLNKYQSTVGHVASGDNPADWLTKFDRTRFKWNDWTTRRRPEMGTFYTQLKRAVPIHEPEINGPEILECLESAVSLTECLQRYPMNRLVIATQRKEWNREIETLVHGKDLPRKTTLGLYWYEIKEGILRAKLRTDEHTRIILPTNCRLTELICQNLHETRGHAGSESIHKLFTQAYLAKGSRRVVWLITRRCAQCRQFRGHPARPAAAPLQPYRCKPPERAFQYVGVDFAGPLRIGNKPFFILLFHCLHSRAIFLKLLKEQTTLGVLHALKQLAARHGVPKLIYSDNAPVFRRGDTVLKQLYNRRSEAVRELDWKFSFPGDPQSNGATEVMIGLTKRFLKNITFGKTYTELELETYLAEVECGLNNRPLYVHHGEVVTPQHFLSGQTTTPIPQPEQKGFANLKEKSPWLIRRRVNSMWKSWKEGYLYNMREQQLTRNENNLQIGDVVIYEPMNASDKTLWPTGTVTATHPGSDGTVRLVDLEMNDGSTLERRPVRKLILLERHDVGAEAAT